MDSLGTIFLKELTLSLKHNLYLCNIYQSLIVTHMKTHGQLENQIIYDITFIIYSSTEH
jgi:hypothetical protein